MAVLDPDLEEKLFSTVEFIRDVLPTIEMAVEVALPASIPVIEEIRAGQTALFELLARLSVAQVSDTQKALVDSTMTDWRAKARG